MSNPLRIAAVFACMVATAVLLQRQFDNGDHLRAQRMVASYRGAGGATLGERVEAEVAGGAWSTRVVDGCRGFVRVTYEAAGRRYEFDCDLPRRGIHPGNPEAARILQAIPPPTPPR